MAPLESTNYQNILAQAQAQLNQLLGSTEGGQNAGGSNGASSYVNSVWGLAGSTEQLISGDDSQKANAINNIVNKLTDLLSSLGPNDSANANKKVKANDKKIAENDAQAQETSMTIDSKLQEIFNQCEAGTKTIEDALAEIQKLGGDDGGEIAKVQEQLDEHLQTIENNKLVLNDDSANSKDRQAALKNILGAASAINSLVTTVNGYLEQIQEQNAVVENASNGISELMTQTSEVITQGIQSIQGNIGKAQQLQGESTLMATESVAKDTAGGIQVAIGEAMTSGLHSVVTGSTGAKYIMSGNDKINAGATLMQGSTQGLAKLTQSVGSMGSYLTEFTNFAYGIGQVVGGTSELVGQYDTTVNAMISSIGSWDVVSEANDQLQTYVTEYAAELPQEMTEDAEEAPVSTEPNQGSASEETNVNTDAENIFKKFEFDTSIFKATSK